VSPQLFLSIHYLHDIVNPFFIGQAYGIFHLAEFAILTHLPLRRLPSTLGSPQAILQRFGISP